MAAVLLTPECCKTPGWREPLTRPRTWTGCREKLPGWCSSGTNWRKLCKIKQDLSGKIPARVNFRVTRIGSTQAPAHLRPKPAGCTIATRRQPTRGEGGKKKKVNWAIYWVEEKKEKQKSMSRHMWKWVSRAPFFIGHLLIINPTTEMQT